AHWKLCRLVHLRANPLMAVHSGLSWLFWTKACHYPYQPRHPGKTHHRLRELVWLGVAGLLAVHPGVPWLLRRNSQSTSRTSNSTDPDDRQLRGLVPVGPISFLAVYPRLPQWNLRGLVPVGAAGFPSIYTRMPWVLHFGHDWCDAIGTGQHQMCRLLQVGAARLLADHSRLSQLLWKCVFPAALVPQRRSTGAMQAVRTGASGSPQHLGTSLMAAMAALGKSFMDLSCRAVEATSETA
ncbi:unnamed protein product, partial [Symbiodinium sp. KB8]